MGNVQNSFFLTCYTSFFILLFIFPCFSQEECDLDFSKDCVVLSIENALSRALNYNRQLINTADNVIRSEYGIDLAESDFSIEISPNGQVGYVGGKKEGTGASVGGGIDFSKKFETGTIISLSPNVTKLKDHYRSDINAIISQPLLRGFGREYQLSNLRGAQFALRSARRSFYIAQLQLVIRTIQSLYEVVKAEKAVLLNEESHERVKRFYQAAKIKEKLGLSDSLDVYRAEIELRHAQDELTSSSERLQEGQDSLRDILALPLNICIKVDVPLGYKENNFSLEASVQMALANRIEIDQAEEQAEENRRLSRIAKKNLSPELNLVMNYSNCGVNEFFMRSCTRHRESTWGIGFTTTTDFNPVGENIAYDQSVLAIQFALRGIDQTKATVILEVKKALRNLDRSYKKMHLQAEQIKTAQGELYLSQLKFERGMADNFNVIQAEKSFRSAQLSYWNALIDYVVGEYQFLTAIGLLTDKPRI